jgi:hypothetical protein
MTPNLASIFYVFSTGLQIRNLSVEASGSVPTLALRVAGRMARSGAALLLLLLLYHCGATDVYQDTTDSEYRLVQAAEFAQFSKKVREKMFFK